MTQKVLKHRKKSFCLTLCYRFMAFKKAQSISIEYFLKNGVLRSKYFSRRGQKISPHPLNLGGESQYFSGGFAPHLAPFQVVVNSPLSLRNLGLG